MNFSLPLTFVGLGSQANAWAHNLKDQGIDFTLLLREKSPSWKKAQEQQFKAQEIENFRAKGPVTLLLLTPDHTHQDILDSFKDSLPPESVIVYAHGQSFHFGKFKERYLSWHHALLAPKAIANQIRSRFLAGEGFGAVYAIESMRPGTHEKIESDILALAQLIGVRPKAYLSSFKDETIADLFSEQSLLCSAVPYLTRLSFEKLVSQGISPELAYMECWFELKLIVDTWCEKGPKTFFELISPAALLGGEMAKDKLFSQDYQEKLKELFQNIESGTFYQTLNDTSIEGLREKVLDDWNESLISKTHEKLAPHFFPKKD